MFRKRIFLSVIFCATLLFILAACVKPTPSSNGLMQGASPATSALGLYVYDGDTMYISYVYNGVQPILDEIDSVKATEAKNWSLDDITLPIYGLWITATDGSGIFAAWSNGYWITQTGTAYSFDFDFANLEKEYPWSDKSEFSSFSGFPCARFLSLDGSGWNSTLLTPAEELAPSDGITMTLESWDKDTVTVNITNSGSEEWMYGEYYSLQVLLDGTWYEIPTTPGHWGFNDIGLIVRAGETQNKTYHLSMYGELPTGTYRLVAFGLSVENTI